MASFPRLFMVLPAAPEVSFITCWKDWKLNFYPIQFQTGPTTDVSVVGQKKIRMSKVVVSTNHGHFVQTSIQYEVTWS